MIKKAMQVIAAAVFVAAQFTSWAQAPEYINYQGRLTDASGNAGEGTEIPDEQYTLEAAMPLAEVGADLQLGGLWNFQIRATANDFGQRSYLYYQPQPDPRLLPERFGLLKVAHKGY